MIPNFHQKINRSDQLRIYFTIKLHFIKFSKCNIFSILFVSKWQYFYLILFMLKLIDHANDY